ncbi:MAG: TIM barrel protein [Clostridiales bacterium]|nr:TIM barrel protein [Clostridiales bacterium]
MIRIGPSGNSDAFYASGRKHTYQEAEFLHSLGLNAFEYSFGRGVSMSDDTASKIKSEFSKYDIAISAHAPYYTNFANPDPEMIKKSISYVLQSISAVNRMGGERVVVHPAACGKVTRAEAVAETKRNLVLLGEAVDGIDYGFKVCLETMGKLNQIGTVEEVVDFCLIHKDFYPCFDFGHINSYMRGGLKGKDDYKRILDYTIDKLGFEKASNMHVHFSKIQYGDKGEIRHLTFEDTEYGPEYGPLAELFDEYKMSPYIVCESNGTMSDDALAMKNMHKSIYKG